MNRDRDQRYGSYDPRLEQRSAREWGNPTPDPHDPDVWRDPRLPAPDVWPFRGAGANASPGRDMLGRDREDRGLQGNYGQVGRYFGFHGRTGPEKRPFRGPKGYTRSDERIHEELSERLGRDGALDASDIEVTVTNREVTLTGTVPSRHEKFRAEAIADAVLGVEEVHNRVRVRRAAD